MSLRPFNEYMRPVLQAVEQAGRGRLTDIRETVADATDATNDERVLVTGSGQLLLRGRIDWAVTYLHHADLLVRVERGTYGITTAGTAALRTGPDVLTVQWLTEQSAAFREWTSSARRGAAPRAEQARVDGAAAVESTQTPDEMIEAGMQRLREDVRSDLSDALAGLTSYSFEQLAVSVVAKVMGYTSEDARAVVTSPTGDGGVDGVLYADRLELQRLYVQAKWWESGATVSRPEIDKFLGALTRLGATAGVFVTSSTFSEGAKNATNGLTTRIKLIDRNELLELMFKFSIGVVSDRQFETKRFDPGFFDTL